jgi:hypothetical protein
MPTSAEPRSHFSRIFADARRLGCKVGTTNEDLHGFTFNLKPSIGATSENLLSLRKSFGGSTGASFIINDCRHNNKYDQKMQFLSRFGDGVVYAGCLSRDLKYLPSTIQCAATWRCAHAVQDST